MNIRLDSAEVSSEPFPYTIIENALPAEQLRQLLDEFPKNTDEFQNVMGGRLRLGSDEPDFYNFIDESKAWGKFYETINSEVFKDNILNIFEHHIKNNVTHFNQNTLVFDPNYLKRLATGTHGKLTKIKRQQVHNVSTKDLISIIISRLKSRLFLTNLQKLFQSKQTKCYFHLDVSEANLGYEREIHHDNDDRILAFVFYLNSPKNMKGGQFLIHEYAETRKRENYQSHPNDKDMRTVRIIEPKENTLVIFLSTPNSYHSVPRVSACEETRKFVYGGLTSTLSKSWV